MAQAAVELAPSLQVRIPRDSRPPARSWPGSPPPLAGPDHQQPTLAIVWPASAPANLREVGPRATTEVTGPAGQLPDPRAWSASLAQAIVQVLQGVRPIGQLTRWLEERVLADLTLLTRRRTRPGGGRPPVLVSVRVQHPRPDVTEAAAHLLVGSRSVALAFRLEVTYDRWLCTALQLGPAPERSDAA